MARLPALVTALAEADGRDRVTLEHIARTVREAGFIQTTKRGSGAAEMTPADAASFLIGANGDDLPKNAALVVPQFRALQRMGTGPEQIETVFDRIDAEPTFGEALAVAIGGAAEIAAHLFGYIAEAYGEKCRENWGTLLSSGVAGFDVTFRRNGGMAASMSLWHMNGGKKVEERGWAYVMDVELRSQGFYGHASFDRQVSTTIGWKTLLKVGAEVLP